MLECSGDLPAQHSGRDMAVPMKSTKAKKAMKIAKQAVRRAAKKFQPGHFAKATRDMGKAKKAIHLKNISRP